MSEIPREEDPQEPQKEDKVESKTITATIICGWCGKVLGTKEVFDDGSGLNISHGICEECTNKFEGDPGENEASSDDDKYSNKDIDKNSITENQD